MPSDSSECCWEEVSAEKSDSWALIFVQAQAGLEWVTQKIETYKENETICFKNWNLNATWDSVSCS